MQSDKYKYIKKDYLKKEVSPEPVKPLPIATDYNKGKYTRYFIRKITDINVIMEIDKKQYDTLSQSEKGINNSLYGGLQMSWRIRGRERDEYKNGVRIYPGVYESNERFIKKAEKKFHNITTVLQDKLQYAVIEPSSNTTILTTIDEDHFHFVYIDDMGNGHTSVLENPKNPNIKHHHIVKNWVIMDSADGCYPNCVATYGYAGVGTHNHEIRE